MHDVQPWHLQIDIKNKRHFLRKTKFDVQSDQLYIGKVLNIFARQMKITDYGDDYTRSKLQAQKQRCELTRRVLLRADAPCA